MSSLAIHSSGLTDIPYWIGSFAQLKELWFAGNCLPSVPESLGDLSNLIRLSLHSNYLTDIPSSLARLEHLKELNLDHNPLNPELASAYKQGLDAVKIYLRTINH